MVKPSRNPDGLNSFGFFRKQGRNVIKQWRSVIANPIIMINSTTIAIATIRRQAWV